MSAVASIVNDLTKYFRCKGEFRQCVLGNSYDSFVEDEIANWQDACGPYLPDDITTPTAIAATRTLDEDTCQTIAESCAQMTKSITSCSSEYTKGADLTSCRCQESIVSLASVCIIDGPESCIGTSVATGDIWEYQNCAAATGVFETSKVSVRSWSCVCRTNGEAGQGPSHSNRGSYYRWGCATHHSNLWAGCYCCDDNFW